MNVSIVWIDSSIAKIYHFSDDRMERVRVPVAADAVRFRASVAERLADSRQILVLSPTLAGREFVDALRTHHPRVGRYVVGCETLHSPDDGAIADYAIRYFRKPIGSTAS